MEKQPAPKMLPLTALFIFLTFYHFSCAVASVENTTIVGSGNSSNITNGSHANETNGHHKPPGIHVARFDYNYVREPLLFCIIMLVAGIAKLVYHHANFLASYFPESCMLIILGIVVGGILRATGAADAFPQLTPKLFFLFLLPPIILESAYSLHDRVFFDNLGTVLLYAVLGTVMACFLLAPTLYGLAYAGAMGNIEISLVMCFVFSSLIVAVDPVAVLAIFQEVGVNNTLYILVFGESLLNDAVTVVLYKIMETFAGLKTIPVDQIFLGIAAFCTVSLGGMAIGFTFGVLTAIMTKYTENVRVVEPLAVFIMAYMSFLVAEMFHFSGIISIICCGLMQAQYAFHNISHKSYTTVKYFIKMQASISDCVIFAFLGHSLVKDTHRWHTGFVLWTLLLCLFYRAVSVVILTQVANRFNPLRKIGWEEQFIMAYGGLRGAVCFSLAEMLSDTEHKPMFLTTAHAVILFTVFIQGTSIKPLTKLLRIQTKGDDSKSLMEELNIHMTDHVMAGVEEVLGRHGAHFWREKLHTYDEKYLKSWLQRHPRSNDEAIMHVYSKIALKEHFAALSGMVTSITFPGPIVSQPDLILDDPLPCLSPEDDVASPTELSALGNEAKIKSPTTSERRRSRVTSMTSEGTSIADVRKMFQNKPKEQLHQKYDPNLSKDDGCNLYHHLQEKAKRTRRFARAVGFTSSDSSSTGNSVNPSQDFALSPSRLEHLQHLYDEAIQSDLNGSTDHVFWSNVTTPASTIDEISKPLSLRQPDDLAAKHVGFSPLPRSLSSEPPSHPLLSPDYQLSALRRRRRSSFGLANRPDLFPLARKILQQDTTPTNYFSSFDLGRSLENSSTPDSVLRRRGDFTRAHTVDSADVNSADVNCNDTPQPLTYGGGSAGPTSLEVIEEGRQLSTEPSRVPPRTVSLHLNLKSKTGKHGRRLLRQTRSQGGFPTEALDRAQQRPMSASTIEPPTSGLFDEPETRAEKPEVRVEVPEVDVIDPEIDIIDPEVDREDEDDGNSEDGDKANNGLNGGNAVTRL